MEWDRSEFDDGRDRTARFESTLVVFSRAMVAKDSRLLRKGGTDRMLSVEREGMAAGTAMSAELAVARADVVEAADKFALSRVRDSATEGADEVVDGERLAAGGRRMGRAVMYSMSKITQTENRKIGRFRWNKTHPKLTGGAWGKGR